jgi:TPR repeat protein
MRRVFVLFFAMLLISEPAFAGYEEALSAYKRGDYETAFREWRRLAVKGHAKAQYKVAKMYVQGKGVEQDHVEAARWYRRAALRGDPESQVELAQSYFLGRGVKQDLDQAREWSKIAAKAGFARAQHFLGVMYTTGRGVPQDYVQAHVWLSRAAVQGDENATKALKALEKRMTPGDVFKAHKLARKVASRK